MFKKSEIKDQIAIAFNTLCVREKGRDEPSTYYDGVMDLYNEVNRIMGWKKNNVEEVNIRRGK